ncbi:hypothetical protein NLJ89_g5467 [Agrocybe chaxingu]|uniref:Uncharacterized protein n=1 Tax=Agrocybe chaxingu TaxID=84603 RepID=A0A9W8K115_9AGAR|nr:hypothetical protein NLJ89_g5467 [Agrocybe chaxingu]
MLLYDRPRETVGYDKSERAILSRFSLWLPFHLTTCFNVSLGSLNEISPPSHRLHNPGGATTSWSMRTQTRPFNAGDVLDVFHDGDESRRGRLSLSTPTPTYEITYRC